MSAHVHQSAGTSDRADASEHAAATVRQAIILAAGRGVRLGELTDAQPKPLMSLHASGQPTLIARQLDQLEARGMQRVTVVVGYLGELLAQELRARRGALHITTVANPDWARSGSGRSLVQAATPLRAGGSVLLTHGDVIFDDELLDALLAAAAIGGSAVAADRGWRAETHDEVVAWTRAGVLAGVRKGAPDEDEDADADAGTPGTSAPPHRSSRRDIGGSTPAGLADSVDRCARRGVGEFVGISVFSPGFAAAFADFVERRTDDDPTLDYEQPLLTEFVARSKHSAIVSFTDDVAWRNVNDAADLAWARQRFAPAHGRGP